MKLFACLSSPARPGIALIALSALVLSGCQERPRAVEVVKPTERSRRGQAETAAATPAVETRYAAVPEHSPTPAPPPMPTPTPGPTPVVLMARDMPITPGRPDSEGGVSLPMNGPIQIESLPIDFPVHKVVLEMKGRPAGGIWPEVDLNTRNQTIQKNFLALPRTYVTTSSYHLYPLPQNPPLPPGDYQVTFRFHNNQDLDGEDRAVNLRKIEFHPEEPAEE